jgi:hypothetical protein
MCMVSGLIMSLSRCNVADETSNDPRGELYAGATSCKECHSSVYESYVASSHFNTTQTSSVQNVSGSLAHGTNTFVVDPETKIVMETRDSGMFQVLYIKGKEQEAHPMDITFGVKHAQTFLYWQDNKAFELPVSWYTSVGKWASSPGYPSVMNFTRSIGIGCFECHSSYIEGKLNPTSRGTEEVFRKSSLINGIDCERCHGPAKNHVNYHLAFPDSKQAKYIVTSASLNKQQKLDACAVCHSGSDKQKEISTFHFKMGDTLANFFSPWARSKNKGTDLDVHGNQYQLLRESKCFEGSRTIDCSTCHSPHADAGKDVTEYSKKCLSCHGNTDHPAVKMDANKAYSINSNCIDCHMPEQPSRAITFHLAGSDSTSAYLLRTHNIGIYSKQKLSN